MALVVSYTRPRSRTAKQTCEGGGTMPVMTREMCDDDLWTTTRTKTTKGDDAIPPVPRRYTRHIGTPSQETCQ